MSSTPPDWHFGNTADDDGQIISELVSSDPTPPNLDAVIQGLARSLAANLPKPREYGRLLTGWLSIGPGMNNDKQPILLLPADANRKHLSLRIGGGGGGDYVALADDPNKFGPAIDSTNGATSGGAYRIPVSSFPSFDDYTGPVWVASPSVTSTTMYLTWYAVTS